MKKIKLNLGAGPDNVKIKGFISVDIDPNTTPDILDDIRFLSTIKDNSVDELRAFNVLEHIAIIDAKSTLKTWFNKLNNGGHITICVPDMKLFCILWLFGYIREDWVYNAMYSSHKSRKVPAHHKSGYDPKMLIDLLIEIKFAKILNISHMSSNSELIVKAFKTMDGYNKFVKENENPK